MHDVIAALIDVAIPALAAGVVAILATVVVERFGGTLGGVLSTIPSTIVPAAIGIYGRSADVDEFRRAMAFIPIGMLLNAGYLVLWRVIPARLGRQMIQRSPTRLLVSTTLLALGAWCVVALSVVATNNALQPTLDNTLLTGLIAFAAGIALGFAANRVAHPAPKGTHRVSTIVLAMRGASAVIVIIVALTLSRAGWPVASGMAAVFPVIFTTIMIATWLAQGAHVPTGAVGPMTLGTLSVSAYALLAAWLFPVMPLWIAAIVAWIISVGAVSVPAYLYLRARRFRSAHATPSTRSQ